MLREVLPFKTAANNLHGHEIKHELLLDDLGGFRFSVKTDSLLGPTEEALERFFKLYLCEATGLFDCDMQPFEYHRTEFGNATFCVLIRDGAVMVLSGVIGIGPSRF